jgi:hypothetical protein
MSFWDVIWFIIVSFAFIAYLLILFQIIGDLFRDSATSGVAKAIWIFFLIVTPFITALVYLIARGKGMSERSMKQMQEFKSAQDNYIKEVAQTSPADQIARAKELLDAGTINQAEFDSLKAKALA